METPESRSAEQIAHATNCRKKGAVMNVVTFTNNGSVKIRTEQIVDRAYACLECHPHFRGRSSNIQICCDKTTLVLGGRLPSYFLKQILQTALRELDGISEIQNNVEVFNPNEMLDHPESNNMGEKNDA